MKAGAVLRLMASAFALALSACGGGGGAEDPKTAQSKASLELAPMDELKSIPKDLEAEMANVTKPIDEVQKIVDDIGALPKKHNLNKSQLVGMAKASFDNFAPPMRSDRLATGRPPRRQ